jgi:hypothetical protein
MKKQLLFLLLPFITAKILLAQDTLPNFSITDAGNNRVIISWTNKFTEIKQISIQRSFDSLSKYKTILTVPDPTTLQNGFVDTKAPSDRMFYRLYILLDKGAFLFSPAKRPGNDSLRKIERNNTGITGIGKVINNDLTIDSIKVNPFSVPAKNKPTGWAPSPFVYTYKDGYVRISLPENDKKYGIKFFDAENVFLFELKEIPERTFRIDKTNFYHSGWFNFELYQDGKLVEKNKFFLQKDF